MLSIFEKHCRKVIIISAISIAIVCILIFVPMNCTDIRKGSPYGSIKTFYQDVKKVKISDLDRPEIEKIIQKRINCYDKSFSYIDRISNCNINYISDIVEFSRKNIRSNPLLGNFVDKIVMCPVVYNVCQGSEDLENESCIDVENKCIESMMDQYWRGSNFANL